jgi:HK97 gp10 family phage protein
MTIKMKVVKTPNLNKYNNIARRRVQRAIATSGNLVRNDAIKSIQNSTGGGITYKKYNPNRKHNASAAGQAPNTDTGFLVSNIFLTYSVDKLTAFVTSRAKYSAALEFGTSKMKERPFMVPALEQNKKKIRKLIDKALSKMQRGSR